MMKEFEIVYWPEQSSEFVLFTDLDVGKLADPISIAREEPVQEEEHFFDKKKSELVDYEDEEYIRLREEEQEPLIITDAESRAMSGMYQNTSDSSSMYFALVNTGPSLRMIPVTKWYKFVQKNQFSETGDVEKIEKNLAYLDVESEESEDEKEIDYVETFDDDNEEDNEVVVYMEKQLSSSGKKIQGIMESYDKVKDEEDEKEKEHKEDKTKIEDHKDSDRNQVKRSKKEKTLTTGDIRSAFKGQRISVKDLLANIIESNFKMGEDEKKLIRDFIHENCMFKVDAVSGEKMLELRN